MANRLWRRSSQIDAQGMAAPGKERRERDECRVGQRIAVQRRGGDGRAGAVQFDVQRRAAQGKTAHGEGESVVHRAEADAVRVGAEAKPQFHGVGEPAFRGEELLVAQFVGVVGRIGVEDVDGLAFRIGQDGSVRADDALEERQRRIVADAEVSIADFHARRTWPDDIARACHYIDAHAPTREAAMAEFSRPGPRKAETCVKGGSYGIPYRALLPRGIANLAVAGRCIGTDHLVQSSARVMPTCFATGQAAGLAAALSLRDGRGGDFRSVPYPALRAALLGMGACLL